MPFASMDLVMAAAIDGSTAAMTPSVTCTSACRGPSGVYTMPPRIKRSVKVEVGDPEQRRVRDARLANVVLAALPPVQHHDEVDHVEPGVAQHLHRAQGIA